MVDADLQTQELHVRKLKRILEGWRVALLPLKSILIWEQQWYPCIIFSFVTIIFLLIWIMDLNFLTTIAVIGFLINFTDLMVPIICNSLYGPSSWTGQNEKAFEDICKNIINAYNETIKLIKSFYSLRDTTPLLYYPISLSVLLFIMWLSSTLSNIFLFYILSITMLLWPGIQHRGIFNSALSLIKMKPKAALKNE